MGSGCLPRGDTALHSPANATVEKKNGRVLLTGRFPGGFLEAGLTAAGDGGSRMGILGAGAGTKAVGG